MSTHDVVVIDYGVGNLLSVRRGLEHCGAAVTLTADPEVIRHAQRVVLPGVGAFRNAMQALEKLGLVTVLREIADQQTPLLGICLGMQLLMQESEEFGSNAGLGLIPGRVVPIPNHDHWGGIQKIPHIGWSALQPSGTSNSWDETLLQDIKVAESAYFVHSYMAVPVDARHRLADCVYGGNLITAVVARDRITGCQFHPEKSGETGLRILRNFLLQ